MIPDPEYISEEEAAAEIEVAMLEDWTEPEALNQEAMHQPLGFNAQDASVQPTEPRETQDESDASDENMLFTQLFPGDEDEDENDAEDLEDLESHLASLEGPSKLAKGLKKKPRGTRKNVLTDDQARMLGEANVAYTQGEYEEALEALNEIIRVAPHANQAWFTLAMIHEELGDSAKALQTYLVAAHLTPKDNALWKKLGSMSAKLGMFDQAIYCFGKALSVDRSDFEALWDRSSLYYDMGKKKRAIEGYKLLLKRNPNDMQVTKELARIYLNAGQPIRAIAMFEQAITLDDEEVVQHGKLVLQLREKGDFAALTELQEPIRKVGYEELNMLAELYMEIDEYEKAIDVIRNGVRRIQGRMNETEWNDDVDDREFDPRLPDAERRYLPMELRVRLGICYLWVNNHRVAEQHLSLLEEEDVDSYFDLFFQVGEAYFGNRLYNEALRMFLILEQHEPSNRPPLWKMMAKCYRALDDLDSAIDRWRMVLEVEPSDIQAMTELADLYMERGDEALANPLLAEIEQVQSTLEPAPAEKPRHQAGLIYDKPRRKKRAEGSGGSEESGIESDEEKVSRRRRRRGDVTAEDLDLRYSENQELYGICKKVWDTLDHGKLVGPNSRLSYERILQAGRKLVNRFQASRSLAHRLRLDRIRRSDIKIQLALAQFGDDDLKYDESMEKISQAKAFQGLSFDEWYNVAVMYAVALSRRGRMAEGSTVLNTLFDSQMFLGDDIRKWRLCLLMLSIALRSKNFERVDHLCRFLMNQQLLQNDPYRIYCAVLQGGDKASSVFAQAANQKYFMRAIKTSEALLKKGGTEAHPVPVLYALYGHILLAARSYAKAVGFYARAQVAAPKDPMIALSCGLAYLNRAMNRQTENRHSQVMQAFAYLFQYYDLRNGNQEACYNIGRAFHQLGLLDLAIPYYEAGLSMPSAQTLADNERDGDVVLESESIHNDDWSDLSRDIAYNLSSIYMSTGAVGLAEILLRRFCTI